MSGDRGVPVTIHESIDSTNSEVRRLFEAGAEGPFWIAAHRQTRGRGRRGRTWSSEPGNLAATLVIRVDAGAAETALFSFTAALAVADTVTALAPEEAVALKWPNDVLLNRCKASGILLESLGTIGATTILAIGIGLNLAHHPSDPRATWPATSIGAETGSVPDFEQALSALTRSMAARLDQHRRQGFQAIRADWLARAVNLGRDIVVRLPNDTLTGQFAGLDMTGALMLEGAEGRQLIAAGDVFFPGVS